MLEFDICAKKQTQNKWRQRVVCRESKETLRLSLACYKQVTLRPFYLSLDVSTLGNYVVNLLGRQNLIIYNSMRYKIDYFLLTV